MRIFRFEKNVIVHVQPGKENPHVREFMDGEGNSIVIPVQFIDHKAEVDTNMAKYLLDTKQGYKSLTEAQDAEKAKAQKPQEEVAA